MHAFPSWLQACVNWCFGGGRKPAPKAARTPRLELLEDRLVPSSPASLTGAGNNTLPPTWSAAGTGLVRIAPLDYGGTSNALSDQASLSKPSQSLQNLLATTSLTRITERNSDITHLQANVFYFQASINGTVLAAVPDGTQGPTEQGLAGATVQLLGDSGTVVAATTTDRQGRYRFDISYGIAGTGIYTVHLVVPPGDQNVTATSIPVLIGRGGISVDNANFHITAAGSGILEAVFAGWDSKQDTTATNL